MKNGEDGVRLKAEIMGLVESLEKNNDLEPCNESGFSRETEPKVETQESLDPSKSRGLRLRGASGTKRRPGLETDVLAQVTGR